MFKVLEIFPSFGNVFLQILLFVIFFYFFGFSTLQKGIEKDVVVVSKIPSFQICHPLKGIAPLKIRSFLFQSNCFGLIFLGSNNG